MTLALVRPGSWDFPLFLHVLGAVVLFGGAASVATLATASLGGGRTQAPLLRQVAFVTMLAVVWPAWVVMRIGAQWILTKEGLDKDTPGWVGAGMAVSDAGIIVLLLLTFLAWLVRRRPRAGPILAGLAILYVLALGVAWFAMTAKPGS